MWSCVLIDHALGAPPYRPDFYYTREYKGILSLYSDTGTTLTKGGKNKTDRQAFM